MKAEGDSFGGEESPRNCKYCMMEDDYYIQQYILMSGVPCIGYPNGDL